MDFQNGFADAFSYTNNLARDAESDIQKLLEESYTRDAKEVAALLNIEENTSVLAEDVSELKSQIAYLNQKVNELQDKLEEARKFADQSKKKSDEAQAKAEAAQKIAAKAERRYDLLLTLFGVVAAEGLARFIVWLSS